MKKTQKNTSETRRRASESAPLTAFLNAYADPIALANQLEDDAQEESDPYHRAYEELFDRFFKDYGSPDVAAIRKLLDKIDGACEIESAARKAGFVMGIAYVRRLLVGEPGGVR